MNAAPSLIPPVWRIPMLNGRSLFATIFPLAALVLAPSRAAAITLPDSSSCSSIGPCLSITNNGTHAGMYAYGVIGMEAQGTSYGVVGESDNGVGAWGESATNNGVRGYTSSGSAAAISAISPNSSGLAYWGQGGIQITGSFAQKAGGGAWTSPSDARIKKDVKNLEWGLEELRQVRTVTFKYNGLGESVDDGRQFVGVIAQELERIFPTMVTSRKAKLNQSDAKDSDIRVVDPSAFTYILINAVKEQQAVIERQDRRIAALEKPRNSLAASLFGGGGGTALAVAMLPLAVVVLRRRKQSAA